MDMNNTKSKKPFKFPIGVKTAIIIFIFAAILAEVAMVFFSLSSAQTNESNYKRTATNIATTTSEVIDKNLAKTVTNAVKSIYESIPESELVTSEDWGSPEWEEYQARYNSVKEMPEYSELLTFLRKIDNSNSEDVECVYISFVDLYRKIWIYVADSEVNEEEQCPPGCIDPLYEQNYLNLSKDPKIGFPAYITNTEEYGWLVTAGTPIMDTDGTTIIGYSGVDLSMTKIRQNQAQRIVELFIYLALTALGIFIVGYIVIRFILIGPIKQLNKTAGAYDVNDPESTHELFKKLNIKTHDELHELSVSIKKMEDDVYRQINELTATNEKLVASQAMTLKMSELANKDGLTGVRSKVNYDNTVEEINNQISSGENVEFGIVMIDLNYLKTINDEFGHDDGDVALIKLSQLICTTFTHSPVYRIGGDEFVVIVRDIDYQKVNDLVLDFKSKIIRLSKDNHLSLAEKASAAIGYSLFNKDTDKTVDDVFKRADKEMYICKREMKK